MSDRPKGHIYSSNLILKTLRLHGEALLGCRTIEKVIKVLEPLKKTPHFTTIRQWIIRFGVSRIESKYEHANDWICVGDITIDIGPMKCLATLGIRKSTLDQQGSYNLTHKDISLLGLFPTKRSSGEFISKAFDECASKIGGHFKAIVLDQGSDIVKGAKMHIERHESNDREEKTIIIHDISHKLSLLLEHTLKDNQSWKNYKTMIGITINRVKQSEVAAFAPPAQRGKDRYMDISKFLYWPEMIWKSKKAGFISEKYYNEYFFWVEKFKQELVDWQHMYEATNLIKNFVRDFGYSKDVIKEISFIFRHSLIEEDHLKLFTNKAIEVLAEEVSKLGKDAMLGSTEVIESIFGKFKEIIKKSRGISGNILSICCYTGTKYTEKEVCESMEKCSVKRAVAWVKERIGETIAGIRRRAKNAIKGQNLTEEFI